MRNLTQLSDDLKVIDYANNNNQITHEAAYEINDVFKSLQATFTAFRVAFKNDEELSLAKKTWAKAFQENDIWHVNQIKRGMRKARAQTTDFVPSAGKFISWCKPSVEDFGMSVSEISDEVTRYQNKMTSEEFTFSHWVVREIAMSHGYFIKRSSLDARAKLITTELLNWVTHIQNGGQPPQEIARIESNKSPSKPYAEQIGFKPTSFEAKALMDRVSRNIKGNSNAA